MKYKEIVVDSSDLRDIQPLRYILMGIINLTKLMTKI